MFIVTGSVEVNERGNFDQMPGFEGIVKGDLAVLIPAKLPVLEPIEALLRPANILVAGWNSEGTRMTK